MPVIIERLNEKSITYPFLIHFGQFLRTETPVPMSSKKHNLDVIAYDVRYELPQVVLERIPNIGEQIMKGLEDTREVELYVDFKFSEYGVQIESLRERQNYGEIQERYVMDKSAFKDTVAAFVHSQDLPQQDCFEQIDDSLLSISGDISPEDKAFYDAFIAYLKYPPRADVRIEVNLLREQIIEALTLLLDIRQYKYIFNGQEPTNEGIDPLELFRYLEQSEIVLVELVNLLSRIVDDFLASTCEPSTYVGFETPFHKLYTIINTSQRNNISLKRYIPIKYRVSEYEQAAYVSQEKHAATISHHPLAHDPEIHQPQTNTILLQFQNVDVVYKAVLETPETCHLFSYIDWLDDYSFKVNHKGFSKNFPQGTAFANGSDGLEYEISVAKGFGPHIFLYRRQPQERLGGSTKILKNKIMRTRDNGATRVVNKIKRTRKKKGRQGAKSIRRIRRSKTSKS
jgi:hypothetical protein